MTPTLAKIVHAAETLGAAFAVGLLEYGNTFLASGHLPQSAAEWRNVGVAAVGAGIAAVVVRVRGYQFGVVRGVLLGQASGEGAGQAAAAEVTPAETPAAKGTIQ